MCSISIVNTAQLHGQRLRPAQETGNKKAESLLSIQQTSIDHPMDLDPILLETFDASSIACSPPEHTSQSSDEIESLPKSSMNSQLICNKSAIDILNLDHPTPSMPFQQWEFTGKFVLITIDAGPPYCSLGSNSDPDTVCKKLAFKLQKIGENQNIEIQEYDLHKHALTSGNFESQFHLHHKNLEDFPVSTNFSTEERKNGSINNENTFAIPHSGTLMDYLYGDLENPQFLDTESSRMQSEDSCCIIGSNGEGPTFSVPDPSQLMNFLYGYLESPVFLSSESIEEVVHSISNYADRLSDRSSERKLISQSADHTIGESHQCSAMQSLAVPETHFGLMTKSLCDSNGLTNGMDFKRGRISSSCQFEKESSEISDSKLSYHRDGFNVADYFDEFTSEAHNALATEPKGPLPKNPTNFVPTTIPLPYKRENDKENMATDLLPFASNTDEPSLMNMNSTSNFHKDPKIYEPSCDQKVCDSNNSMFDHPCLLGDYGSDDDAEVAILSDCTLNDQCCDSITYNTLNLPIESKNGSLAGAFEDNKITPNSSISVECKGEKVSSNSSFFDLSDHDDLLEYYGLNNQNQYTDVGYNCESPSWPGKSEGQLQKSQACLTSNLTVDENGDGTLASNLSSINANKNEKLIINKKWTVKIYEEYSENSVSPCYLNQMEPALNTDDAGSMDCVPLLHSCSDDFGDSIEHQSPKNDGNELLFAFPDPSTLKDHFFGGLDSPQFLALELLDGKIDNLHYQSIFGYCEQSDRTEEADLSDKIFDQCSEVGCSKNGSSINKLPCSIQLFDLISSPIDISNHDELLEWYGVNDHDQSIDGNWACDSPTWPGKM